MATTSSSCPVPPEGVGAPVARRASTIDVVTVPQTTPATISAVALPAQQGVLVSADPANSAAVEIGFGAFTLGNGQSLNAGDSFFFRVGDAAMIFAASASTLQKLRVSVL